MVGSDGWWIVIVLMNSCAYVRQYTTMKFNSIQKTGIIQHSNKMKKRILL